MPGRKRCETIASSCTVAGIDGGITEIRLVDRTSADARSIGSYLSLSEIVNTRGKEHPHALAALVNLLNLWLNVKGGGGSYSSAFPPSEGSVKGHYRRPYLYLSDAFCGRKGDSSRVTR